MKNKKTIQESQASFILTQKKATQVFINHVDKSEIETILLSGSVARGDFFPGKFGGMIDLIVMKKKNSRITCEDVFGPNQNPEIPYHCIKYGDFWFQILFTDFIQVEDFVKLDEPRKFSVLEAEIIYDPENFYKNELIKIKEVKKKECFTEFHNKLCYIKYLLSDYKKDRWYRRSAFLQMHENLNTAIRMSVCCLYYINNSYVPAEDRQLYYSLTLEKLPADYEKIISRLKNQTTKSFFNYKIREKLFIKKLLSFIEKENKIYTV